MLGNVVTDPRAGPQLTHERPRKSHEKATKMEQKITKSHEHHNHDLKRVYDMSSPLGFSTRENKKYQGTITCLWETGHTVCHG